jgi:hypothetical protein
MVRNSTVHTLYNFLDMSVHGESFISSFVKSAACCAMPNLRIASCSIDNPPFFLDLFENWKKDESSAFLTGSIASTFSIGAVPFVPFFSVS